MNYKNKYNEWVNSAIIDEETKKELTTLTEEEKEDCFYKDLEFGTSGLRGIMGPGTNRMNRYTIAKISEGLANHVLKKGFEAPSIVIAYDSRKNSKLFATITALIFNKKGIKSYIFKELTPTPVLAYALLYLKCSVAVNITSSHNAKEYNGYKIYNNEGFQVVNPDDTDITNEINKITEYQNIDVNEAEDMLNKGLFNYVDDNILKSFADETRKTVESINNKKDIKIVYTPLHGTGTKMMTEVLNGAGFIEVYNVLEQRYPDSDFKTTPYPNPEDTSTFEIAKMVALKKDADIIIATDPDADRMGVMIKDKEGGYNYLSGNQVGVLLADYIIKTTTHLQNRLMIRSIVTTTMIDKMAKDNNILLEEVYTGTKYIGEKMAHYDKTNEKNYIFGFEESIGYLIGKYVRDKNSFSAALAICELCAYLKNKGICMIDYLRQLYDIYSFYSEETISDTYTGIEGVEKIKSIMEKFRSATINNIIGLKVTVKEDFSIQKKYNYDTNEEIVIDLTPSNVLRYTLEDGSWFAVRPSGTEPKIKYYLQAVADNKIHSKEKLEKLKEYLTFNFR